MILLLDGGNTRLKWATWDGSFQFGDALIHPHNPQISCTAGTEGVRARGNSGPGLLWEQLQGFVVVDQGIAELERPIPGRPLEARVAHIQQ